MRGAVSAGLRVLSSGCTGSNSATSMIGGNVVSTTSASGPAGQTSQVCTAGPRRLAHRASGVRPCRLLDRRSDLSKSKLKAVNEGRPGSTSVACGRDATRRIAGIACRLADTRVGDSGVDAEHRLALDRAIELAAVRLVLFPTREEPLLCSRGIGDNGRASLSKTAKTGSSDAIDDSLDLWCRPGRRAHFHPRTEEHRLCRR
jgi:hypothetical protein